MCGTLAFLKNNIQTRLPQAETVDIETLVDITMDGPVMNSWNGHGPLPTSINKMSLETALELDFSNIIVNNVPNNKKAVWIEACVVKTAIATFILPFVPREGAPFPCSEMKTPMTPANRQAQINHQMSCNTCVCLGAVDFHPQVVTVPAYLIWQTIFSGALELWETRECEMPSFNNLVQKDKNEKPDPKGATLIISGMGRHADSKCDILADLRPSTGVTQSLLTLFMRLITYETKVKGRATLCHLDFRPNAHLFLQALTQEQTYRLSKNLEQVALELCPLLRQLPARVRAQEHPHVTQFKQTFYKTYKFAFCDCEDKLCPINSYLDKTGARLLEYLTQVKSTGFIVSLSSVMGSSFTQEFIVRNLNPSDDGFRLSAHLQKGEIFFADDLIF